MMIKPGSTIGIIGGGQLGQMMAMAAANLGYRVHIFTPEHDAPAASVAAKTIVAKYTDRTALTAFANDVSVISFEFENIPVESLKLLEDLRPVYPSPSVLHVCRNRIREKTFINTLGIGTAPFARVTSPEELHAAIATIGLPAILKTTELGYDGKGQVTLRSNEDAESAWTSLATDEAVLEGFVDFTMEISVIVARSTTGEVAAYVPVQNIHKHHILDTTIAPAPINEKLTAEANRIATTLATALNVCGLLAIEMFVTRDGRVLVNELAPRPHNSGHWTMDACLTGQFEQSIRAVCGLPLGNVERLCDATMQNLIGEDVLNWEVYLKEPNAKLHLYGKKDVRAGRKMGHVTRLLLS